MDKSTTAMLDALGRIGDTLTSQSTDYYHIGQAIREYHDLLLALSGIELETQDLKVDIHSKTGKAIGTSWAARCVDDISRTKQFVRGLAAAITELKAQKEGPIHLLYAGTGPYATLLLPLLNRYTPEQLQLTLLEINPASYESVKRVFDQLGYTQFIKSMACTDVTQYQIPAGEEIDLLLSETMQHALKAEQQVPIFMNLIPQLAEGALIIPESIDLALGIPVSESNNELGMPTYRAVASVFQLNKATVAEWGTLPNATFPKTVVALPNRAFKQLAILTDIKVFKDIYNRINESGLTSPAILCDRARVPASATTMSFQYTVNDYPQLEYSFE